MWLQQFRAWLLHLGAPYQPWVMRHAVWLLRSLWWFFVRRPRVAFRPPGAIPGLVFLVPENLAITLYENVSHTELCAF